MFDTTMTKNVVKIPGNKNSAWNLKQKQFLRMVKIMLSVNFSIDDGFSVMI